MAKVPSAPKGRPSSYTEAMADQIIRLIEEGGTIRQICGREGFPEWETVRRWLRTRDDFQARYAQARIVAADAMEAEIIATASQSMDRDSAAAARVKVDALKWIMAKRNPRVYGDKQTHEHTGPGGGPIQTQTVVVDASALGTEQAEALAVALRAAGAKLPDEDVEE